MVDMLIFGGPLLTFALTSGKLERIWIGAPIAFVIAGFLVVELRDEAFALPPSLSHPLAEAALVILLFHDASKIGLPELRAEAGIVGRLLLVGFPLTVIAGYWLGWLVFPGLEVGLLLFLAAALAPTDAGLGGPTITNPAVPRLVRSSLNVESGLNDGLVTRSSLQPSRWPPGTRPNRSASSSTSSQRHSLALPSASWAADG